MPLCNDRRANAWTPLQQQQVLLRPPQAVGQFCTGKCLDVVFQQDRALQRLRQQGRHLHRLVPDAVGVGADPFFPVHRTGDGDPRPQQLFAPDAVFPEQRLPHVCHLLQEQFRRRSNVGGDAPGAAVLAPQVTQGDAGGRHLDADGKDIAVGVVDPQQDLPPSGPIALLHLAQLDQNVLRQQFCAQRGHTGRGQTQPGRDVLAGHGIVVVQQLQDGAAVLVFDILQIEPIVCHPVPPFLRNFSNL